MVAATRTVSVFLRPGKPLPGLQPDGRMPRYTREALASEFGATAADRNAVQAFARSHGLSSERQDAWRYELSGTPEAMSAAFAIDLAIWDLEKPLPAEGLPAGSLAGLQGLSTVPMTSDTGRPAPPPAVSSGPSGALTGITPGQVATLLEFPDDSLYGAGQKIAVLEGDGGIPATYSSDLALAIAASYPALPGQSAPTPQPLLKPIGVAGGAPNPENPGREVELDLQLVQTLAPAARVQPIFYGPGWVGTVEGLATAVMMDGVSVITWSDEAGDLSLLQREVLAFYCQVAACVGITICKGAGDDGAYPKQAPADRDTAAKEPSVYLLPSLPWVLSSGGVMIEASAGAITWTVWNTSSPTRRPHFDASGGGFSPYFPLPDWQKAAVEAYDDPNPSGPAKPADSRGVPDVASIAYLLLIFRDNEPGLGGGCSATGPVMAAMIARLNAIVGRNAGFINPLLYGNPSVFVDVTHGNNGVETIGPGWTATPGWDPCTGLGVPRAGKLLELLQADAGQSEARIAG